MFKPTDLHSLDRAPARAMLIGAGFTEEELKQPLVAIFNTWTEVTPCNSHLRELAKHIKDGVRAAGGTPIEFNCIAVSDGITMGRPIHARLSRRWDGEHSRFF